jgi:FkbM family methyltransferase
MSGDTQMGEKVLGKNISRLLQAYYLAPDHPMKLRVWYGIHRMLGCPRLTIPYVKKGWITIDVKDFLQREILVTGYYEPEVWNALFQFITEDEVVWDIGAHIGSFAIRALLNVGVGEVHAFEPDPIQASILRTNLALNKGKYIIHQLALNSQPDTLRLYHGPQANTGLSSFIHTGLGGICFDVECETIDYLTFQEHISFPTLVKIDVEGWEFQVLQGARRLLAEVPPKAIVFESECAESGEITNDLIPKYLEDAGYSIQRIVRLSGVIDKRENFLATYKGPGT